MAVHNMIEIASPIGIPVLLQPSRIEKAVDEARTQKYDSVLVLVTATKPCFYKMWPLINEATLQNLPFFVLHSGQHYDDQVGYGLKEFDFSKHLGSDLRVRGDLCQKTSEIYSKTKLIADYLKEKYPGIKFVPYVNGDTLTAAHLPSAWLFATGRGCIQGEAGLRSMSPEVFKNLTPNLSIEKLIEQQWQGTSNWILNRTEPFPEQYDTFVSAAACDYFFAPVLLNSEHLVREGYDNSRISVCGNTVADAVHAQQGLKLKQSVFDIYPCLKNGSWLRADIHRRENLSQHRFLEIINTIDLLVKQGTNVVLVELTATKRALEHYQLISKVKDLEKSGNFLFTPLWKEYAHVIEFISSKHCSALLTDSGSLQEEANVLGKPCFTVRFSTDRPETVHEHANLLVPPLDHGQMRQMINHVRDNPYLLEKMRNAKKLYGSNVSEKIIRKIKQLFDQKDSFFTWANERLKIYKEDSRFEYL